MRVTDTQLNEYIALCQSVNNSSPEPTIALNELNRILNLVLYLTIPEDAIQLLEDK